MAHVIEIPAKTEAWANLHARVKDGQNAFVAFLYGLFASQEEADNYDEDKSPSPIMLSGEFKAKGSLISEFSKPGGKLDLAMSFGLLRVLLSTDLTEEQLAETSGLRLARKRMAGLSIKHPDTGETLFTVTEMKEEIKNV